MEPAFGEGNYKGKHVRQLIEGSSIAYIPHQQAGKDFGPNGWGTGKTKLLITKKKRSWNLYIFETGDADKASWERAKAWFHDLSDEDKKGLETFSATYNDWDKTHRVNPDRIDVTKAAIQKRVLQSRIAMHKDNLLKSMKPDLEEFYDTKVIKLFSLFEPGFQSQPNDLNIYGDSDFVFLDDRYTCIDGKEELAFAKAEEVCKRIISGR
jgi:hypothetical protein